MPRNRAASIASTLSSKSAGGTTASAEDQELGTMYDYLAKIILLGPSGCGKSCLLHRFVKGEWKVLTSQTIGVEFSSKIVRVGTGPRSKRIKLQLWDTAGQERFRSVTRSYYRGASGALLVYDVSRHSTFAALPTFLSDARALASSNLTLILVGNKNDLTSGDNSNANTNNANTNSNNTSSNNNNNSNSSSSSSNHERYHRRNGTNSTIESVSAINGASSATGASTSFGSVASTFSTSRFDTGSKPIPTLPPPPPPAPGESHISRSDQSSHQQQGSSSGSSIYSTSTSSTGSSTSLASTITPNTYGPAASAQQQHLRQHPANARHRSEPQNLLSSANNNEVQNNGSELTTFGPSHGSSKKLSLGFPSARLSSHPQHNTTSALHDRPVLFEEAHHFAISQSIPSTTTTSALTGENVDEVFHRLARMILTKIELGEVDPDDPGSGIQYGDYHDHYRHRHDNDDRRAGYSRDGPSGKMDIGIEDDRGGSRTAGAGGGRRRRGIFGGGGRAGGSREEWEEIFAGTGDSVKGKGSGKKGGCC